MYFSLRVMGVQDEEDEEDDTQKLSLIEEVNTEVIY